MRNQNSSSAGKDTTLVYSSVSGRVCGGCGRPVASCNCKAATKKAVGDGVVRVRRETKGRGGKTVTVISGLPLASDALKLLAGELKKRCGAGGTISDGNIEIQGDFADSMVAELQKRGYQAKRAGG